MEFQRDFILKFCAIIILVALIISGIVYALSMGSLTTVFENSHLAIRGSADFILPLLVLSSLASIVAAGLATVIITLFISHRIAGPIYRLEKDIAEINNGNLKVQIQLRQKDELQELAKSLNQMVKTIQITFGELKKELTGISTGVLSEADQRKLENAKNQLNKFKC